MRALVLMTTVREEGLKWQLDQFSYQSFKDFEIIIIDAFWRTRSKQVSLWARKYGLTVHHAPTPELTYLTELTHASNRNACIEAALRIGGSEVLIFFDDYQVPAVDFVEKHVNQCRPGTAVVGRQISLWYNKDRNYGTPFTFAPSELEHDDARITAGHKDGIIANTAFWTGNASVSTEDVRKYGLMFDERMNGGTGGEDGDFGLRFGRHGVKLVFDTSCCIYHISHKHVRQQTYKDKVPKSVDLSLCDHNRAPFTVNQYQQGDYNLVEAGSLYTWRDLDTKIKYYLCKNCGLVGCIDSIEVMNSNSAPDMRPLSYVYPDVPKSLLVRMADIYIGTGLTYYADRSWGRL